MNEHSKVIGLCHDQDKMKFPPNPNLGQCEFRVLNHQDDPEKEKKTERDFLGEESQVSPEQNIHRETKVGFQNPLATDRKACEAWAGETTSKESKDCSVALNTVSKMGQPGAISKDVFILQHANNSSLLCAMV